MKFVAAFLMAKLSKDAPTAEDIKTILSSVDCEIDEERLSDFMAEIDGKDVNELITAGSAKMASLGGGGGAAAAPAAGAAAEAPKAEAKKEEVKEESDEGMDDFGLFD
ncbi:60S acidic ribosomal protein P2 [Diplonema papillatum]|nr:60S acidic ribosomal protein P2 [Diplonema papillatum]|eukprot:gene16534-25361_t